MDGDLISAIGAAMVAVLALIANIFSAIGSARSADKAGEAEDRIRRGERDAAARELRRTAELVVAEAALAKAWLESAEQVITSTFISAGQGTGSSRLELYKADLVRRQKVVSDSVGVAEAAVQAVQEPTLDSQIALDRALIDVRSQKEFAKRFEDRLLHQSEIQAIKSSAGWGRG